MNTPPWHLFLVWDPANASVRTARKCSAVDAESAAEFYLEDYPDSCEGYPTELRVLDPAGKEITVDVTTDYEPRHTVTVRGEP